MKDEILSRAFKIDDEKAAQALADPLRRRLVLGLVDRERSMGELARTEKVELKRLHYHVTALVMLGLLTVTGERRRAGRAIKTYRAVADAFFVPEGLTKESPGERLNAELRQALRAARQRTHGGVLFFSEGGTPRMRPVAASATGPTVIEQWQRLYLSRADAAQLAEDIARCIRAYAGAPRSARQEAYLVHVAAAPA